VLPFCFAATEQACTPSTSKCTWICPIMLGRSALLLKSESKRSRTGAPGMFSYGTSVQCLPPSHETRLDVVHMRYSVRNLWLFYANTVSREGRRHWHLNFDPAKPRLRRLFAQHVPHVRNRSHVCLNEAPFAVTSKSDSYWAHPSLSGTCRIGSPSDG
jgi:hypothetical protein